MHPSSTKIQSTSLSRRNASTETRLANDTNRKQQAGLPTTVHRQVWVARVMREKRFSHKRSNHSLLVTGHWSLHYSAKTLPIRPEANTMSAQPTGTMISLIELVIHSEVVGVLWVA